MKTEIKNTLYRFVTMRAPELLEKGQVDANFVQHPEIKDGANDYDSHFLSSISPIPNGKTKKQALVDAANGFAALENRYLLRNKVDGEFYDFAIWLSKNRANVTADDIEKYFEMHPNARTNRPVKPLLIELWDNLFYQIITFRSNYVRDEILSVLVAEFFVMNYKKGEDSTRHRVLAQARVIMPKAMFSAEENVKMSNKADMSKLVNTKDIQDVNTILAIQSEKKQLEDNRRGIVACQKKYIVQNQKELISYNADFDDSVKQAYQNATATEVPYALTEPTTTKEKFYTKYENLVLPEYNFKPKDEMDFCLAECKNAPFINFVIRCISDLTVSTFKEIIDFIDEKINSLTARQFEKTVTSKKVVNVNGTVFSTSNNSSNYARLTSSFAITTLNYGNNKYLAITFTAMEANVDIVSGSYTIDFSNGDSIEGEYQNVVSSVEWINGKLVLKILNYPSNYFQANEEMNFSISASFISSTGRVLNLTGYGNVYDNFNHDLSYEIADLEGSATNYNSNSSNYIAEGKGNYNFEDLVTGSSGSSGSTDTDTGASNGSTTPETGNETPSSTTIIQNVIEYVPSGYGVKRLGIADYRRVEQEICCYVPGEVSHIENVMAREYKEKATRRLRRQEDTITTSKEKESEKLSDTTSTERFEMNQEVSSVIAEQNSLSAGTEIRWNGMISGSAHADFAHNTSQETSNNQALTSAQEVTARVLDRVVQKVKEERVTKIIEEYEENNKHGYDNRKGDKHISGVYRWVDKIYRNQIVNYGKRLMYEFMIPEPAAFHNKAIEYKVNNSDVEPLIKPIDPRTVSGDLKMKDFKSVTEDTYPHWSAIYNAEVEPMPSLEISVGESFSITGHPAGSKIGDTESNAGSGKIKIPEGYYTTRGYGIYSASGDNDNDGNLLALTIGNITKNYPTRLYQYEMKFEENMQAFYNEVPVSYTLGNHVAGNITATVKCSLSDKAKKQWQIETFNAIITAYEDRLREYNEKMAELKAEQLKKRSINPLFYREIENTVLRKNCIEYLVSHDVLGKDSLLRDTGLLSTLSVKYDDENLETYATKVRFFEQAFEWNLMSYFFYPFYWAHKENWEKLYNVDEMDDPIFRAFLQSGMARVIITVRPGFEEAVNWYLATGQVWNGGQVPTMDDPLFVSIVQELQQPEGVVEQTWESRVPTSLTVIQAGTIGLNVEGLPCDADCEDNLLFDSDGQPVLDPNGDQVSIIGQNLDQDGNPVQLGNITDDLQAVSESIEEIKDDIEEIKTTLDGMAGGN